MMRKRLCILLLCALLLACVQPGSGQNQTQIVQVDALTPSDGIEVRIGERTEKPAGMPAEPEPLPESALPEGALPTPVVADGALYGCDLVCFVDGYGLCCNLGGERADRCRAEVERAVTPDVPPFESHRLLLYADGEAYCLGELRYNTENPQAKNIYGLSYELVVMDSDLVDIEPVEIAWERIAPMERGEEVLFDTVHAGFLSSFDESAQTVGIVTLEMGEVSEDAIEILPDTIGEEETFARVTDRTILTVIGSEYEMPVTRERFFQLLADGYVGFFAPDDEDYFVGCFLRIENGELRYLREMDLAE